MDTRNHPCTMAGTLAPDGCDEESDVNWLGNSAALHEIKGTSTGKQWWNIRLSTSPPKRTLQIYICLPFELFLVLLFMSWAAPNISRQRRVRLLWWRGFTRTCERFCFWMTGHNTRPVLVRSLSIWCTCMMIASECSEKELSGFLFCWRMRQTFVFSLVQVTILSINLRRKIDDFCFINHNHIRLQFWVPSRTESKSPSPESYSQHLLLARESLITAQRDTAQWSARYTRCLHAIARVNIIRVEPSQLEAVE